MRSSALEGRDGAGSASRRSRWRGPLERLRARLAAVLAGGAIALSSPAGLASGEPKSEPPSLRDDAEPRPEPGSAVKEPAPSPPPATSNRARVQRYVESIEPTRWLRRFGEVEIRDRR